MVVDDEPDTVELVTLILESEGYKVMPAYGGREALEILKSAKPDLILLDIMMPDIDGWTVYESVRENDETKDIPVVMLTAMAQSIDKMIGLHVVGVDEYITKPFTSGELIDGVKAHLIEKV